ncbi:LLM class flavin-dependent oxidoreductase [Pseudaminobacter sp. 19-2017]|uniref:LLM class flavin-dependent oxidoreductase n=1 Tax=Pseudaminobacter soli (ex Zhang et al. 2022) TaxID=2831468 RepID=A0A942E504_9HYPH|nr:LLM class flavin-dependent oxidoreductase [Pseudaminobacter soli]MBS3651280.1 LLM class flavin-dependent oxidoreductase [Pseudaminobacter soli]
MSIPKTILISGDFADWTLEGLRDLVNRAETAGVETIVLPDGIAPAKGGEGWPDALILIGWLAAQTSRIRLAGMVSSLGHQPYNLARRLASLDLLSRGRAGWLVATDGADDAYAAFSGKVRLEGVDQEQREREFATVVKGLWQSWDTDALVFDKEGAQFFRPEAMHTLDHKGEHFSVRGPLNVMRSPRGTPDLLEEADIADAVTVDNRQAALAILGE